VITDVHAPNRVSLNIEGSPEVAFDDSSMDCLSVSGRELVDLVRAQPRIERVLFENLESGSSGPLLFRRQFR
jgi:hypothetical protein